MRALLVTSRVTFIPDNYDSLILGLASHPNVCGLLLLDNRDWKLAIRGAGLALMGAPRIGLQLVRNQIFDHTEVRRKTYEANGKFVHCLPTINSQEAVNLVREKNIDLIVNARTRFIFKQPILDAPRLGCINVHHGILPEQRGTMCDLWALSEGEPAGFTVHQMDSRIDAGGLVHVEKNNAVGQNYYQYLEQSSKREAVVLSGILNRIAAAGKIETQDNLSTGRKHRRNPTRKELQTMRAQGMRL